MVKQHLKRLNTPKSWPVKKKGLTFITRPKPGSHSLEHGVSIDTLLKDMLHVASSTREVEYILFNKELFVNGVRRKERRFLVGLFDTVTLPASKKHYRILINTKGKLQAIEIDEKEAKIKPSRVIGKTLIPGGKFQINMGDGRNFRLDKNAYATGDTLVFDVPEGKINQDIPLAKKNLVYLISGKHTGRVGVVEEVKEGKIMISTADKELFETKKEFAFPIGKDKPIITLIGE
ncbi:MAG: 30S ribosomal protein S4e [archaeon]